MIAAIGQYVGGKVLTAILIFATFASGFWFWKHPEHLETIWKTIKYVIAWIGFVGVLPWATAFITMWVMKFDNNIASGILLAGYLAGDIIVALMLAGAKDHNTLTWTVLVLGFAAAFVYNFLVCEKLAEYHDSKW